MAKFLRVRELERVREGEILEFQELSVYSSSSIGKGEIVSEVETSQLLVSDIRDRSWIDLSHSDSVILWT